MLKKIGIRSALALLSGLLLAFSWPNTGDQTYLIFVAFLPLLILERKISTEDHKRVALKVFLFSYLTFLTFNLFTTWWIKLASTGGMVLAEVFNSLFMSIIFLLFHLSRKKINDQVGYASLVFYWLAFEYLHINWELNWHWLNLGHVFANRITWIQWYEYTGSLGGTFWVLSVNTLLFYSLLKFRQKDSTLRVLVFRNSLLISLILIPFIISIYFFYSYSEKENPVEIVLVQPNIDPYKDKFKGMHEYDQIDRLISLARKKTTPSTDLVIGPETAFPLGYWEHELEHIYGTKKVRELLEDYPNAKFITGLSTIKLYSEDEESSPTARALGDGSGNTYDYFNTVMQVEKDKEIQIYRKSRLVLGVEKMPFASSFAFLEKLSLELGGASGSLGIEKEPLVFTSVTSEGKEINVIPAICYESIFSEYLSEFVGKGGNLLAVVTNDGWWGNTAGYEQHLAYSRLRAIELRRSIARSANTGISALINQKGEILQQTEWWVPDSISGTLNLNNEITFYARHGDYFGRIAAFFAVLLLAWTIVKSLKAGK